MACAAPRCKTKNVFVRCATVIGRVKPAARSSPSPASDCGRITEFNITNSMGRLTLNIPLSFAQFERAVTGERIRDKIAAPKKKGMWMGGMVPLGYDTEGCKLDCFVSLRRFRCWNIHPTLLPMTLHLSVQNRQLPKAIAELRILRRGIRCTERSVEPPEDLLEGVVVALAVAARQVGVAARRRLQQGRILYVDLIGGIAMTRPQLVRPLLFPCHGRLCAVDLDAESVF